MLLAVVNSTPIAQAKKQNGMKLEPNNLLIILIA